MEGSMKQGSLLVSVVAVFVIVSGGLLFYRMVAHMETMTLLMGQMTGEVTSIHAEMKTMRESMQKMEGHMERIGRTVDVGAREMERINPMRMMEGIVPGKK
jgi:hypothetical protein